MCSGSDPLHICKNTQNQLFCQTTNSDELAVGMKRWLEVHFLSLKNNFCQIKVFHYLSPKNPTSYCTHSCIILGYYINGSNITNITSSMLQTCQAINLDMGYEFVALRLVSISQTYECTQTSPIYTTMCNKNHMAV